jgi:hypothetical protein
VQTNLPTVSSTLSIVHAGYLHYQSNFMGNNYFFHPLTYTSPTLSSSLLSPVFPPIFNPYRHSLSPSFELKHLPHLRSSVPLSNLYLHLIPSFLSYLAIDEYSLGFSCHLLSRWYFTQPIRSWRRRRYVSPKRRSTFNGLHGIISQKIVLFDFIFVTTPLLPDPSFVKNALLPLSQCLFFFFFLQRM